MAHLSLSLLGRPQATLDGVAVAGFESQKVRALLAYLAVEATRPHARDALAGLLWPEQPDHDARNNLRQALANLRQALGDQRATPPFLLIAGATIRFNRASDHHIDVAAFTALLDACDQHPHRHRESCTACARRLGQAADLYHGDFLDQFFLSDSAAFEEWALLTRERVHRRAIAALAQLADYHERRGEDAQVQQYARRLLELDPWRETSHRQLMRLLARGGQRSAALLQYATCRRVLAEELGVEPEEETTVLCQQIQRGEALMDARLLPATNLAAHTPPTPLIGRESELAQIADRLEQRDCRLLTLVGPGGVGKTRLALQAASDLGASFPDGVAFVPLAPLNSAELIVPAIAGALGFTIQGAVDPETQLFAYLRTKDMLLVLDNFEQLLAGVDVLNDLVQAAPGVVLLVTSREPLHLRMEWLLDIPGLPVPERADDPGVEQSSAVRLFAQTARRMQATFALSPATNPSVVRICQLVDGMPLAIELAAAWMRSRSCSEIARGLEQSLEQLATTMRDVPVRHRSMRAVFDHSWHLLSAVEQGVLGRLSVFRGGMEADAAASVADATPALLSALVDKSLLRRTAMGRYDLHELVRQYASEKLELAGEAEGTRNQHASYFLALAQMAEPKLYGAEQVVWLNRLEAEHNNLRAALTWSRMSPDGSEIGLRLAGVLWWFWEVHGHLSEGRIWLEAALAGSRTASAMARATALLGASTLAWGQGDYTQAQMRAEESLALFGRLADKRGIALSLFRLGRVALIHGDDIRAATLGTEALALIRERRDPWGMPFVLSFLGDVAHYQGNYGRAVTLYQEGLALARAHGDTRGIGVFLSFLGRLAYEQNDYDQATKRYQESLTLFRELEDPGFIAGLLNNLGDVARDRADHQAARSFYQESLALFREMGDKPRMALALQSIESVAHK